MKIISISLMLAYTILYDDVTSRASVKDTLYEKSEINTELFGHSLGLVAMNYAHNFYHVNNILNLTWRCGIGWLPGYNTSNGSRVYAIGSVPIVLSCYLGSKNNPVNLSVGYTGSFGRKWEDTSSLTPLKFKGYESSFIISIGYRHRIKDAFLGLYPYYVWGERTSTYERLNVCIYAGITLKR